MDGVVRSIQLPGKILPEVLLALLLVFMSVRTFVVALSTYSPIDKSDQAHCYDIELCTFLEPLNQSASSGSRVFVLNAYRYYLRPDLFACSSQAQDYGNLERLAKQDSPDFWLEVYRQGFRYITYENNYANFHTHFGTLPAASLAPAWLHVTVQSSTEDGLTKIYQIEAAHAPIKQEFDCRLDASGTWVVGARTLTSQE